MDIGSMAHCSHATDLSELESDAESVIREFARTTGLPAIDMEAAACFANATSLALISVDASGAIRFANRAATDMLGFQPEEMLGQAVEMIIPERLRAAHASGFARAVRGERLNLEGRSVEVFARRRDGTEFPIELTLCAWHDARGMAAGAVIKDISERRERETRLHRLASQDTLTGLYNRNRFTEVVGTCIDAGRAGSVIIADIDGFKDLNDLHGHAVGDSVLQSAALRLASVLPRNTAIARLGGDEFAAFLPDVGDVAVAREHADAVSRAFVPSFEVDGRLLDLGASIGLATSPGKICDSAELIANADLALFRARGSGTGATKLYDSAMKEEAVLRRTLRDDLLRALRNRELEMHYQPQVHLMTGEIFGLEALIRWRHPSRGLLAPGHFLPSLDQSALALEIGWWTLDEACGQAAQLNSEARRPIKMGVNLFPGQLHSPSLCSKVTSTLMRHGLRPELLELEVTETTALFDDDKSLDAMKALRDIGVGIAFDDFGTGYASLSSLQRYPLTTLKIDRAFVKQLSAKPRDYAIARALIAMSRDLGLETIAEGIETLQQESLLRKLECPAAQGYRYGKPMPFEHVRAAVLNPKRRVRLAAGK